MCAVALMQAVPQANQFLNFCVSHKKKFNQENIPFVKTRHIYVFIKGVMSELKTNVRLNLVEPLPNFLTLRNVG